jgi:DNA helicase-2/ATP-dependent DNA helicase PcrA
MQQEDTRARGSVSGKVALLPCYTAWPLVCWGILEEVLVADTGALEANMAEFPAGNGGPRDEILRELNPPQREAVEHEGGPLLVLAGAGSGKTRVLTRRVAWLIGVRTAFPGSILAVTFTNKAAGEMKERIISLVGDAGRNAWVGTFHSVGARILRREAQWLGLSPDFSIYDRADSVSALKRVLANLGISPKEHTPESLVAVVSREKNALRSPENVEADARGPFDRLIARVYREYQEALRQHNALDFDDLLVLPVRLLETEDVRRRYADLFRHVLVDEYQDTNLCQYEFLHRITRDHRQLFVVGDDDQSIYRWRGADLSNILGFERDYPDARVVRLEQNYRSTKKILAAANSVIRQNVGRKGKELWTENDEGDSILVLDVPNEQVEAMVVLRMVKTAIEEDGLSPNDFVVLYRTNAQSRVLENTFQLGGMAYQVGGGQRFYDRREIKDVLAYLRLLVNPEDDVSLPRIINVPARGIGKKTLEDLQGDARGSLLDSVRRTAAGEGAAVRPAARGRLAEFLEVIDRAREQSDRAPVVEITEQILEDIDYQHHLEKESERDAVGRWENVTELLTAMQEFADARGPEAATVVDFLQEVSLVTDIDDYDERSERVTLMTLHNAKGLEFPWVFIAGMEEGLFPHANSSYEKEGLEEERRLFYVGITRARERVTLLNAGERRRYGGSTVCSPSRFLKEIAPEFVERQEVMPRGPGRGAARSGRDGYSSASSSQWDSIDHVPSYEDETQEAAQVQPGMRVMHPSWGEGIVDAVEGSGENLKFTIRFRGGVVKKVLAIYARLELLG